MTGQFVLPNWPRRLGLAALFCAWVAGAWAQSFGVNIVSPTNGQFFSRLPADISIAATVTNAPGVVARVEFFGGANLLGVATNAPYSVVWTNAPSGTNVIRAVAYAEGGSSVISPDVTIRVNHAPTVAITTPVDQGLIGLGSNLVMVAAAADPEGAIGVVYFYVGVELMGSVENPPYQWAVSNLVMGDYVLTAVAEDNWGVRSTSGPVRVSVIVPDAGIMEDFERGPNAGSWSAFSGPLGVDVLATNYGGAVSGTNALWFGGDDERYAVTRPLALRAGATVEFWLRISGGNGGNWNLAELPDEGVLLEFANDGGEWKPVSVFDTPLFTNWQRVSLALPLEALGTNTVLRWRQPLHSGEGYSHWALDDVLVMTGPTKPVLLQSPQAQIVAEGETAVFSALARGSEPLGYQWRANGINIPGATSPTLTISNVTLAMSGWNIAVVVSNDFGSINTNAPLTVNRKDLRIAVYDHPAIVDTTSGGSEAESENVQASLRLLTNVVVGTFTNLLTAGMTNDILWFPEFEKGALMQYMTAAERQAISGFVSNGGLVVIHGVYAATARCQNFLNQVFGFSVQVSQIDLIPFARTAAATGTAFAAATNSLYSWPSSAVIQTNSLPSGSLSIYGESTRSLVAIMPAGKGKVIFLGWDWNDAQPLGTRDDGWLQVMACTVVERTLSGPLPPGITTQPASQRVLAGSTATFSISAMGTLPLAFQWQFESTNLPGATNALLTLTNLTLARAGNYRVVVTNQYGSTTSSNAQLEIVELNFDTFQIVSLGTNNAKVVDHYDLTGDDHSSIAASSTRIFYSGDNSTARFRLEDLTEGASLGRVYVGMVSDLRTEQVYCLANGFIPIAGSSGGTITTLLEMDVDTGAFTGNQITLSTPISVANDSGIFAGSGQITIHNGMRVYSILLPSGTVMDLGAMTKPTHANSEGWAYWGVAEYFGGRLYLTCVRDSQTIVRARVPDGAVTTVATFSSLSDMACFTVVPRLSRWYFHYEGSGQFGGTNETLGYASANFNYAAAALPPFFYGQTANRLTAIGGVAQFSAAVYGSRPLSYQWQMMGTNLPSATNKTLYLAYAAPEQAGDYQLIASNAFGVVTSAVAKLTVVDVGAGMFDDFEPGIDLAQWSYFSGIHGDTVLATNYGGSISPGSALWINNTSIRDVITRALNTTAGGTVSFHLRLGNGPSSFWELVDLPSRGITLDYSTNGTTWTEMGRYETTNYYAWTWVSEPIPPAAQGPAVQFRWRQLINNGTSTDHWVLDDVMIATGPTAPAIARQPQHTAGALGGTALLTAVVNGSKPLRNQWQYEAEDLPGATNTTLLLTNLDANHAGNYRLLASNALGVVTSGVATVTVLDVGQGLHDAFEPGINLAQWSSFGAPVGGTVLVTNYGGSVSPGNALWFGNNGSRYAITRTLNTTAGGVVGFCLRLGFGAAPWETVDLPGKEVVLEYSTNGTNWMEMGRYATPDFYSWTQVTTNLPAGARGPAVQFRWRQLSNNGVNRDHWALDEVFIATGAAAPAVIGQSTDITAPIGGAVSFSIGVTGSRPLIYQWQFEGVDIPGTTNATLDLSNLATNQAGDYRVVVTNVYGAVTSAVMRLALVEVGAGLFEDFEPGLDWLQWSSLSGMSDTGNHVTNYGGYVSPNNSLWFSYFSVRSIVTRSIDTSAGGVIAFYLRLAYGTSGTWETVELPTKAVLLEYSTNRTNWVEMGRYNTTNFYAWTQVVTNIPPAAQGPAVQFRWRQTNFITLSSYDHWALDDVIIATGPAAPVVVVQPVKCVTLPGEAASFTVRASGSVPLYYQWQQNGVALPGATNATLAWSNVTLGDIGQYTVLITNAYGSSVSSNAALQVLSGGVVGYFTDNNVNATNAAAVIQRVGMTPVHITNITTFEFNKISCLMLNEAYYNVTSALINRLPDIRQWVAAGGVLVVHDADLFTTLAVGSTNLAAGSFSFRDLSVSPPDTTAVTQGPFGILDDASLDQVTVQGYITGTTLPPGARPILHYASDTNSVAAFSYPVEKGYVYYTAFNLDSFLAGNGTVPSLYNVTNTYAPNMLVYMHGLGTAGTAPRMFGQPANQLVAAGTTVTNRALAVGDLPMAYQWQRYGTNLPGATNELLTIPNMQLDLNGLYSVVVSNAYGAATSSMAAVVVNQGTIATRVPIFVITNPWRYNQSGLNLGTAWRETGYSDTNWPVGAGLLAFENNAAITPYINTTLSLSNGNTRVTTYYFRSWVTVPVYPANLGFTLVSSNLVDDGAVFYLNGIEQGRFLMTNGTVAFNTYALTDAPENVYNLLRFTNSAPVLGTTNLLAVEVHQRSATSSDVVFGMAMFADVIYPYDPPYINSTPVEIVVNQGQPFSVSANASSVLPMTYQWWLNGSRLAFTQATINITSALPFQAGVYQVVASNLAGVVTSVVARVTVVTPPGIAQGPLGQELELGSPLMLQVVGTGGALNYLWRQGGQPLAGLTNAQMVISNTSPAQAGTYDVVVWNAMGAVTSVVAQVTFRGAYLPVPSLVLGDRALQLRFNAPTGVVYQVEASEDLRQWSPLGAVTNATGTVDFLDYGAGERMFRFYRLRAGP